MYQELKRDILKLYRDGEQKKSYNLRGINGLTPDDISNLMSFCTLYEREGEIKEPWKERISNEKVAEVLVKYQMW